MEHQKKKPENEDDTRKWESLKSYLESFNDYKGLVIPILQKTQEIYGYLPKEIMRKITSFIKIPGEQIYGVATFYSMFRHQPMGENIIKVCHGTACHVQGADMISDAIMDHLKIKENETSKDEKYTFTKVACLGCCSLAPVMMINDDTFGRLSPDKVRTILDEYGKEE